MCQVVCPVLTIRSVLHILGIYLFLSGFLLTRLVLNDKSECSIPPVSLSDNYEAGSVDRGCWYPKTFDKAVVIIVDALRYDFTVPFEVQGKTGAPRHYHNALPLFYETSAAHPQNSFLLPFIADPPTTTLQRLKGLTTGTLPTFIDAGSNFAGTAIDEDNLVAQLWNASKKVVHLGDDTWHSLFPGYFEPNLTKPYDSFNVWDLFTVDNGVNEHLFPLLDRNNTSKWDVIFGHYLGVDHAGHRYGPDHPAMTSKLNEMNDVFTRVVEAIDDNTLLVVMGDHGMDAKGDHGGESDDEVEAALWMYSKKPLFGRMDKMTKLPPATAKERPVRQIDLVPTLSLLLGMPIPFNNLGRPINEAFVTRTGADFPALAKVNRLTAGQIHRYQKGYAAARKLDSSTQSRVLDIYKSASEAWNHTQTVQFPPLGVWTRAFGGFKKYQEENLDVCRSLWARFNDTSILGGIQVLVMAFVMLAVYAQGFTADRSEHAEQFLNGGAMGLGAGGALGLAVSTVLRTSMIGTVIYCTSLGGIIALGSIMLSSREKLEVPLPSTFWGWLCSVVTVLLCGGFAANSFTIWEDEILLFLLTTFGVLMLVSSLRQANPQDRTFGAWQSISFIILTRISSLSRLCREEQMPFCKSTYYSSVNSSTSAWWQLIIPFIIALFLPYAISSSYARSRNYTGFAQLWIGTAFRIGLFMSAMYWILDAADDNNWLPAFSSTTLKTTRVMIAQLTLGLAFFVGYATYIWASPFIEVEEKAAEAAPAVSESIPMDVNDPTSQIFTTVTKPEAPKPKLIIMGYANTHGTRYFLLVTVWCLALLLLQKPMGQGTLSLLLLSIISLLEVLDANNLRSSPLGPVLLALLGQYYFFKTGHQATLASIQWETAFIPLSTIKYPWSPAFVVMNTFAPQILCALAVPAVVFWKVPPRTTGLLDLVSKQLATHALFYTAVALATVVEANWLRRHLMLYRIFMPRMLMAVVVSVIVQVVNCFVALGGVRWSVLSVAEVFGWG